MSFSDYLENRMLNHLFNKGTYPIPTIFIGLHISDPGEIGGGEVMITVPPNGYARQETSAGDWHTAAGGSVSNASDIFFPEVVVYDWGTITHFGLYDSGLWGGGNLLVSGIIIPSYELGIGSFAWFEGETLSVTLV